jgi:hypothetical protein
MKRKKEGRTERKVGWRREDTVSLNLFGELSFKITERM